MTYLEEYGTKVLNGEIVACEKIKRIYDKLLNDAVSPGEYHFDANIAKRHIVFIERFCKQAQGKMGEPLRLELFQKAKLEAIFGFVDDDNLRKYREVLDIRGRKNGKTTEMSAVCLDLLVNDQEGSPEIYTIATKLDQAKKCFDEADKMRRQSPILAKEIRKRMSDLYFAPNMGVIKALASNSNSLDGLNAHGVIIDELAAIKNRDIYDLMKQSMSSRKQSILFCITTNGFVRDNIFDSQYEYASSVLRGETKDDKFLPFIYELDSPDEWDKPECWIKANPALGTIKSVEYLTDMVAKAKADPSFKPTVLVKDFNLKQTSESSWLTFEETESAEADLGDYRFDYCIGGFDAADTTDLNAATALCKRPGDDKIYRKSMYWIPESVITEQERKGSRRGRDSVPYDLWISQGYMRTCPGNKCDKRIFLDWFRELKYDEDLYPIFIGYDPWHISDELLWDFKCEFGPNAMIPVRQGVITLSEPMKNLKADLQAKRIVYDNPIDQWCLINTCIKTDVNGNIQPIKSADRTQRIDGTAAFLDAYRVLMDREGEYTNLNKEM